MVTDNSHFFVQCVHNILTCTMLRFFSCTTLYELQKCETMSEYTWNENAARVRVDDKTEGTCNVT